MVSVVSVLNGQRIICISSTVSVAFHILGAPSGVPLVRLRPHSSSGRRVRLSQKEFMLAEAQVCVYVCVNVCVRVCMLLVPYGCICSRTFKCFPAKLAVCTHIHGPCQVC